MTVRERVLTSRLIEKISKQEEYAGRIGLSVKVDEQRISHNSEESSMKET